MTFATRPEKSFRSLARIFWTIYNPKGIVFQFEAMEFEQIIHLKVKAPLNYEKQN